MAAATVAVTGEGLDPAGAIAAVTVPQAGAIALFVGLVRPAPAAPEGAGSEVVALEYDAHPALAENALRSIAGDALARWPLGAVVAVHRIGTCALGEPTVVVACSSEHRSDALSACRWIIDEIKASVPIWKKEIYAGRSAWVGPGPTSAPTRPQ